MKRDGILGLAIVVFVAVCGQALAGKVVQSPMEQCAGQWHDLKAANAAAGRDYRTFTAQCLKTQAAMPQAASPQSVAASAPVDRMGHAKMRLKRRTPGNAKTRRPSKMALCAAQWQDMKAGNRTNGLTYRQWTSQCMKAGT